MPPFTGEIMHRLKRVAGTATALLVFATGSALAQDKLKIATEGAYPPFNSVAADGSLVGFDVDIAHALCAEMKTECELVTQDWDGMIPALQAGKFDAIVASLTITEERKRKVSFTDKYYTTPLSLVASKDSDLVSTEPAALAGKALGVQAATIQSFYADDVYGKAGAEVRQYPTQEEADADLSNGRLDAVMGDNFVLMAWLKSAGKDCCRIIGDVTGIESNAGIAVRKEDEALRDKLNSALYAILANGTYAGIAAKYFDFEIYRR